MIDWINKLNLTPVRIIVSILLAVQYVLSLQWAIEHSDWVPKGTQVTVLYIIAGIILTMMGFDVAQWVFKRHTDIDYQIAKRGQNATVSVSTDQTTVAVEQPEAVDANTAVVLATGALPAGRTGALTRDD